RKGSMDWLRYRHILPDADPSRRHRPAPDRPAELITDVMGYNSGRTEHFGFRGDYTPQYVGDLILESQVQGEQTESGLCVVLAKGVDRFQASWQLADGSCTLYRLDQDGKRKELDKADSVIKRTGTYRVRFANVDERLTVWVDGKLLFGDGVSYAAPRRALSDGNSEPVRGPLEPDGLEPARLGVKSGAVRAEQAKLIPSTDCADG